jgi:hypothetical protein
MSPTPHEEVIVDVADEQVRLGILYWSAKNELVEFYFTYTDDEEILERAEEGDYEPLAHRLMRAGDPFNKYDPPTDMIRLAGRLLLGMEKRRTPHRHVALNTHRRTLLIAASVELLTN